MIKLCQKTTIEENSGQEFTLEDARRIFIVHKGGEFFGYTNNCPHADWPLNLIPTGFLDADKNYIQCANHMALFEIATGECISGPCLNRRLEPLPLVISDEGIFLSDTE